MVKTGKVIKLVSVLSLSSFIMTNVGVSSTISGQSSDLVTDRLHKEIEYLTFVQNGASAEGEEIFSAIFFGAGSIKDSFEEKYRVDLLLTQILASKADLTMGHLRSNDELDDMLKKSAGLYIKEIKKEDPTFFEHFKRHMTSGDVEKVEAAFKESAKKIIYLSAKLKANALEGFDPFGIGTCFMITVVIAEYLAIALVVVATIPGVAKDSPAFATEQAIAYYTLALQGLK